MALLQPVGLCEAGAGVSGFAFCCFLQSRNMMFTLITRCSLLVRLTLSALGAVWHGVSALVFFRYRDGALAKQLIRIDALGGKQVVLRRETSSLHVSGRFPQSGGILVQA